jgi:hypothetical protein
MKRLKPHAEPQPGDRQAVKGGRQAIAVGDGVSRP